MLSLRLIPLLRLFLAFLRRDLFVLQFLAQFPEIFEIEEE